MIYSYFNSIHALKVTAYEDESYETWCLHTHGDDDGVTDVFTDVVCAPYVFFSCEEGLSLPGHPNLEVMGGDFAMAKSNSYD